MGGDRAAALSIAFRDDGEAKKSREKLVVIGFGKLMPSINARFPSLVGDRVRAMHDNVQRTWWILSG